MYLRKDIIGINCVYRYSYNGGYGVIRNIFELIKKKGIMFDVFLSHILVLIIPVVMNICVDVFIINSVRDETEKVGTLIAETASNNMDYIISNVALTIKQINSNESMLPIYLYKTDPDLYNLRNSINTLNYTCQNTEDIEDIFVYNEDCDIVITKMGRGVSESFVEAYYADTNIDYQTWKNDIDTLSVAKYRIVYDKECDKIMHLEYICPLTGNRFESYNRAGSSFPGVIIVRINFDNLQLSDDVKLNYKGISVCAVNSEGTVICKGDTKHYDGQYILTMYKEDGVNIFKKDGNMYICKKSKVNDWIYVSSVPVWKYNKNTITAILIMIIGTLVTAVLSVKIIVSFVKNNYGCVSDLSRRISDEFKIQENLKLEDINKYFDLIITEHKNLNDKFENVHSMQIYFYVLKLLEGSIIKNDELNQIKEYLDSEIFCVVCCKIEDCDKLYVNTVYEKIGYEDKMEDARLIIENVLSEFFETKCSVISVPTNDSVVFLIGNKKENSSVFKKIVLDISENFAEYVRKQFMINCVVAVGDVAVSGKDISESYDNAIQTIPYLTLLRESSVAEADKYINRSDGYSIKAIQKQHLLSNILSGNESGATDILNELFEINIFHKKLSIEMIRCFVMELSEIYEEICSENTTLKIDDIAVAVFKLNTIDRMWEYFKNLTVSICDDINYNKADKHQEIVNRINSYIDMYYMDKNIDVFAVSNALGFTRAYVSKIFKQYAGKSILDTIHEVRIEHACELLKSDISVNDAGEKVGYVNASVFIRNFKKYKGITPKQYKDTNI